MLTEQLQGLTTHWDDAEPWRRSSLRDVDGNSQGWPALVVEVVLRGFEEAAERRRNLACGRGGCVWTHLRSTVDDSGGARGILGHC